MILRILNPPHAGAQAEIGSEPLSIGSGMDCDLILSDPLLQPAHCKIQLTSAGIEVELTGGAAHLDGAPMEKSPFLVKAGQVLTIGSTHMAFGEADAVWGAIEIPELKTLGGAAPVDKGSGANGAATPPSEISSTQAASASRGLSQPVKIGIAATTLLGLIVGLLFFFYNADQKEGAQSVARASGHAKDFFEVDMHKTDLDNQAADKVAERIKREVSGATVSGGERSGKAFLKIFVRTRAQANEVQKIVNASTVPVFSEIISLEEIEKSSMMMASMKGFSVEVVLSKDGTAYWKGYLPTPQDWKEIQDQMEKDLPHIKANMNNLTFADDIEKRANELVAAADIKTQLAFKALSREVVITGAIPENQSEAWSQVRSKLRDEFGSILTITDKVTSGKPVILSKNPFHSPIVGVTLGSIPAVLLLDGQRIYEGTILKDGSVLTKIRGSDITLIGPEGTRSLPLNMDEAIEKP